MRNFSNIVTFKYKLNILVPNFPTKNTKLIEHCTSIWDSELFNPISASYQYSFLTFHMPVVLP